MKYTFRTTACQGKFVIASAIGLFNVLHSRQLGMDEQYPVFVGQILCISGRYMNLCGVERFSMHTTTSLDGYLIWPVLAYGSIAILLIAAMIILSYFLGEKHRASGRNQPYESGIQPTGSARLRYGAKYYLVGIFFMLFDVEAAFIFAWAIAFRELGWPGYVVAVLFIITLALGLVYIWKMGVLDWSPDYKRRTRGESR